MRKTHFFHCSNNPAFSTFRRSLNSWQIGLAAVTLFGTGWAMADNRARKRGAETMREVTTFQQEWAQEKLNEHREEQEKLNDLREEQKRHFVLLQALLCLSGVSWDQNNPDQITFLQELAKQKMTKEDLKLGETLNEFERRVWWKVRESNIPFPMALFKKFKNVISNKEIENIFIDTCKHRLAEAKWTARRTDGRYQLPDVGELLEELQTIKSMPDAEDRLALLATGRCSVAKALEWSSEAVEKAHRPAVLRPGCSMRVN